MSSTTTIEGRFETTQARARRIAHDLARDTQRPVFIHRDPTVHPEFTIRVGGHAMALAREDANK